MRKENAKTCEKGKRLRLNWIHFGEKCYSLCILIVVLVFCQRPRSKSQKYRRTTTATTHLFVPFPCDHFVYSTCMLFAPLFSVTFVRRQKKIRLNNKNISVYFSLLRVCEILSATVSSFRFSGIFFFAFPHCSRTANVIKIDFLFFINIWTNYSIIYKYIFDFWFSLILQVWMLEMFWPFFDLRKNEIRARSKLSEVKNHMKRRCNNSILGIFRFKR